LFRSLAGPTVAFGLAMLGASQAAAAPALWVIHGAESTVYLFGSVHILKPELKWRTPAMDKALAESQEVVFEIPDIVNPAFSTPLMMSVGLDPSHPLEEKLSKEDFARLATAADRAKVPLQMINQMRPWLAAQLLDADPEGAKGYAAKAGVERVLTADALAASKRVSGLETVEQQWRIMADLPEAAQLDMLRSELDQKQAESGGLDRLVAAWASGDQAGLAKETSKLYERYPALYDRLVAQRNRVFADELKARLAGRGVSFVAIGAGHFVGPDGVLAELAKRGIKAEQIQ
jgi:uncharacterized protein YbaP (TraB family)